MAKITVLDVDEGEYYADYYGDEGGWAPPS